MLMMRRHEKDFMMREKIKYIKQMELRKEEFILTLNKSNVPANAKKNITIKMLQYHKDFNEMAKGILRINKEIQVLRDAVHKLEKILPTMIKANNDYQKATQELITYLYIAILILIALFVSIYLYMITKDIIKSLSEGVSIADKLSNGDLTMEITPKSKDETGQLLIAMKKMLDYLRKNVSEMSGIAETLATTSEELNSSAGNLSDNAQRQAASVDETSASIQELTTTFQKVSGHASSIREKSSQSLNKAKNYKTLLEQASEEMNGLSVSAEKIGDIVKVINDIADQTNLLSLNAAIEAARAGEHGRGFAVVAEAISTLATRSAESTKEIEKLITESVLRIKNGVQAVSSSSKSFDEIMNTMAENNMSINEIVLSMDEQHKGSIQIQAATDEVNQITQSVSASAEEMSATTNQLYEMAEKLNSIVNLFKVTYASEYSKEFNTKLLP